jgi:hypothetical protein
MNFLVLSLIKAALVAFVLMTTLAYLQWIERKVIAHIQLRVGPRRVGPHGLLQPLADVIKVLTKEDMLPSHVNKVFYFLAPFIAVFFALIAISVIPFGGDISIGPIKTAMQLTDLNIGVLFILGLSGMGVYGVALAGWASNNKYALLGGLRSSAQMISYELPMAMAIAAPLLMLNTLSFRQLVDAQGGFYLGIIQVDDLPRSLSSGRQFSSIRDRRVCGNQSRSVRSAGGRERTRRGIPHRILQHEVRSVFHGRIREHGYGFLRRDIAVPGRLAAAVPSGVRVQIYTDVDIFLRRRDLPVSRRESGACVRQDHAAGGRYRLSWNRRGISGSDRRDDLAPAVLVFREGRCHSLPLYMGPRHASAIPL